MSEQRGFSSSFGAIMAAVGSAVGLGNIWRFPYICGKYGGGAFLLVYLAFVFLLGMMLMLTEFIIGRRTQHGPVKAFTDIRPKQRGWKVLGWFSIITVFSILALYCVVAGWTCNYVWDSASGLLSGLTPEGIEAHFTEFSTNGLAPVLCLAIFLIITAVIILGGVQKGIEAVSKILMPVLIGLVLILCVRSLTLPGAMAGVAYLFKPDFSLLTSEGILAALGQALFSLSVGMGVMVVYGSYLPKEDNLFKTAMWITACDTLIAILAGVAIFPALFSCGMEPAGGPGLVFMVLPNVFNAMGGIGGVCAVIFFVLLALAALTSAISLLETLVQTLMEGGKGSRLGGTVLFTLLAAAVGIALALSLGPWDWFKVGSMSAFDFVDSLNSIYLPPLTALGTVLFLGWFMPKEAIFDELSNGGKLKAGYFRFFYFIVRYLAPIALILVLVTGILQ